MLTLTRAMIIVDLVGQEDLVGLRCVKSLGYEKAVLESDVLLHVESLGHAQAVPEREELSAQTLGKEASHIRTLCRHDVELHAHEEGLA